MNIIFSIATHPDKIVIFEKMMTVEEAIYSLAEGSEIWRQVIAKKIDNINRMKYIGNVPFILSWRVDK